MRFAPFVGQHLSALRHAGLYSVRACRAIAGKMPALRGTACGPWGAPLEGGKLQTYSGLPLEKSLSPDAVGEVVGEEFVGFEPKGEFLALAASGSRAVHEVEGGGRRRSQPRMVPGSALKPKVAPIGVCGRCR